MGAQDRDAGRFPWATFCIIATQVLVFAIVWVASGALKRPLGFSSLGIPIETLVRWGANVSPYTWDGQWWRLITNKFLSQTLLFLLVVVWAFWGAGRVVERVFGAGGLLLIFFGATLLSSMATLAFQPYNHASTGSGGPTLAAFGAIIGYVAAVRSPEILPYLRPIRFSGPVFVLALVPSVLSKTLDYGSVSVGLLSGFLLGLILSPTPGTPGSETQRRAPWPFALVVIAVMAGAIATQMKAPPYLVSEEQRLMAILAKFPDRNADLEKKLREFNSGLEKATPPYSKYADELEQDHLREWRALRRDIASAPDRPEMADADYLPVMKRYLDAQIRFLEEWSAGMRTADPARIEAANKLSAEAKQARGDIMVLTEKKEAEKARKKSGQSPQSEDKR